MSPQEFLKNDGMRQVAKEYLEMGRKGEQKSLDFNLFQIVGDKHLHECCHSKILAALLRRQPLGHTQIFARRFIEYLKTLPENLPGLDPSDFDECVITEEKDKMDVCLKGQSNKVILIENKINYAPDQPMQIPNYLKKLKDTGYHTVAVVYLTRDGKKRPNEEGWLPEQSTDVARVLICVSAHSNSPNDLVTGWLKPCQEFATTDEEVLIRHYCDFLENQGKAFMINSKIYEFAKLLMSETNNYDNYEIARAISEMFCGLEEALGQRITESVGTDFRPFSQSIGYDYLCKNFGPRYCAGWDQFWYEGESSHLALAVMLSYSKYTLQFFDQHDVPGIPQQILNTAGLLHFLPDEYKRGQQNTFDFSEKGEREMISAIRSVMDGLRKYQ